MKTANKLTITALLATISIMQAACAQGHANDGSIYQFFDVERQKSSPNALRQYEKNMQGTLFGMYPTYWRLNYNLSGQSPEAVNQFVHQYPSTVMSENSPLTMLRLRLAKVTMRLCVP